MFDYDWKVVPIDSGREAVHEFLHDEAEIFNNDLDIPFNSDYEDEHVFVERIRQGFLDSDY